MSQRIKFNEDVQLSTISSVDLLASKKKSKTKHNHKKEQTKSILKRPKELPPLDAAFLRQRHVSDPKLNVTAAVGKIRTSHKHTNRHDRPGSPKSNEHHGKVSLPHINGKQSPTNAKQERGTKSARNTGKLVLPAIDTDKKNINPSKLHALPYVNSTAKRTALPDINKKGKTRKQTTASRISGPEQEQSSTDRGQTSVNKDQNSELIGQMSTRQRRSSAKEQQSSARKGQTSTSLLHALYNLY